MFKKIFIILFSVCWLSACAAKSDYIGDVLVKDCYENGVHTFNVEYDEAVDNASSIDIGDKSYSFKKITYFSPINGKASMERFYDNGSIIKEIFFDKEGFVRFEYIRDNSRSNNIGCFLSPAVEDILCVLRNGTIKKYDKNILISETTYLSGKITDVKNYAPDKSEPAEVIKIKEKDDVTTTSCFINGKPFMETVAIALPNYILPVGMTLHERILEKHFDIKTGKMTARIFFKNNKPDILFGYNEDGKFAFEFLFDGKSEYFHGCISDANNFTNKCDLTGTLKVYDEYNKLICKKEYRKW